MNAENIVKMIKMGNNPEQLMLSMLGQMTNGNPLAQNLLKLAQEGKGTDIEIIARNIFKAKGLDFDKEFATFKQQMKL